MKVGVVAESPIERIVLAMGQVPTPLFETLFAMLLARTVMVATTLGVFEALSRGPLAAADVHETVSSEAEWSMYQRGMRSVAAISGSEVAQRTPVPHGARDMLDIGGSHGYNSVVICRRHPGLRAVVLDLPKAVEQAAPILANEGMGDRVVHEAGNALTDDLGTAAWDVIFIAQLVHHFDEATNRELARRVARALRPNGVYLIQEVIRPASPAQAGQTVALMDLYFALTGQSGTWSFEDMADWQRQAGLSPQKPIRFRRVPGVGQQVGVKARAERARSA